MEDSYDEEPERWHSSRKLPFKQISFGLKQIINDGVPGHLKELQDALQLTTRSSTSAESSSVEESSLCRSRVQQALSLLMQDVRSLEEMCSSVKDDECDTFKEIAGPCCRQLQEAIQEATKVIVALEMQRSNLTSFSSNEASLGSPSSGFGDTDEQQQKLISQDEELFIDNQVLHERSCALETLKTDIEDLQEMMLCLNKHIVQDAPKVDAIETHVETAVLHVGLGEKLLRQARHLKTAALPTMGATVGFIAGGPIGAVAGIRVGIAASVLGTAVGYFGGKLIHKSNRFVPSLFQPTSSGFVTESTESRKAHQS